MIQPEATGFGLIEVLPAQRPVHTRSDVLEISESTATGKAKHLGTIVDGNQPWQRHRQISVVSVQHSNRKIIGIALFSAEAQATEAYLSSTVKAVYPHSPSCTDTQNPQYFHVAAGQNGVTAEGVKTMLAAALTAYATASPISIAFDTSTTNCYLNRLAVGE
jgi:hypothetical protein